MDANDPANSFTEFAQRAYTLALEFAQETEGLSETSRLDTAQYDGIKAAYEESAWDLVQDMAKLRVSEMPEDAMSAAAAVLQWLRASSYYGDVARRYVDQGGPVALGNWVEQVLYPVTFPWLHPDDVTRIVAVRDSFTRAQFDRIDWPSVAFDLLS
jgi:1,4-alpha-glucan branching enzyme